MKSITYIFTLILLTALTVSAAPVRDVPTSHWAKGDVDKVVNDYGLMQGDPNGYFGGNKALTRYEFAKTISRLIEYYNGEIDSDRKDIENMVSIMELFQNELKTLENKLSTVSQTVDEQNKIIGEINEIAVTLGEEFQSQANSSPSSDKETMAERVNKLEHDIDKLQNKGLIIDTLVKGTFNDVKNLGKATARVVSGSRRNVGGPAVKYQEAQPIQPAQPTQPTQATQPVQPNFQAPQPRFITPTQPTTDNSGEDSMAPEGADSSMYNPYDVEIMEDLGE